jgi:hypothetical protein
MKFRQQDLIHPPDRLEAVQIMLCRFAFNMAGFVGQEPACWMNVFITGLQDCGNRMLGEPIDLKIRMELAQLVGDGDVTLGVAQSNGGGDVEGSLASGPAAHPTLWGRRRFDEIAKEQVDLDWIAKVGGVARAFQQDQLGAGVLGESDAATYRANSVLFTVDD